MTRALKIEVDAQDDGTFVAWFTHYPSHKVRGGTVAKALENLKEAFEKFKSEGGDPTSLASE